jgi:hypothetical protein
MRRHTRLAMLAGLAAATISTCGQASTAQSNFITGDIGDITSVHGALLVKMDDNRVPTQCAGSGSAWMKIDQTDTAMTSLVLSYWLQGKRGFTLYIDTWTNGYCSIGQADPVQ